MLSSYRAAFGGLPRSVWLISLVAFINRSGTVVLPFLSLYLTQVRGLNGSEAGVLLAVWGLGAIAGAWLGGTLTDRIGPRPVLLMSLVSGGLSVIILGQLQDELSIGVGLFLTALFLDMFRPPLMSSISAAVCPELRPRAFALARMAVNLAMTLAPAAGGFLALYSYQLLFWVDGVTCLLAAIALLVAFEAGIPKHAVEAADPSTERVEAKRGVGGSLVRFFALLSGHVIVFMQLMFTMPLYLNEHLGLAENWVGMVFAVNTVTIVALEMLITHRIEAWRPLRATALGTALVGLGFGAFALGVPLGIDGTASVVLAFGFAACATLVWTFGEMVGDPMTVTFVSQQAPPERQGRAMAGMAVVFGAGHVVAPLIGMPVYTRFGPTVLWTASLCVALCVSAGYLALDRWLVRGATPPAGSRARPTAPESTST